MSRGGMSSGGGRSSLGYLFKPEETTLYHKTAKSNQETEKTPHTNSSSAKDDRKVVIVAEADQQPPQLLPPLMKEVSNPILSSNRPCNIYHTSQLSYNNTGFLITDRPSTRVSCAPGGPSSLGFLFGDEKHEK